MIFILLITFFYTSKININYNTRDTNLSMDPECRGVFTVFHSKLYSTSLLNYSGTGADGKSTHSGHIRNEKINPDKNK